MKQNADHEISNEFMPFLDVPFEPYSAGRVYETYFKRAFDIFLVLASALPALCITLLFAALVALDGSNPFYTQNRIGRGGRSFRIWKLRSMVANTDATLKIYLAKNPQAAREWAKTQKLKNDPRVTPIGRFIRKTSIDELPQLWNVLNGTMSLVGPRPMVAEQKAIYNGTAYFKLRPGLTGSWQVSERHNGTFSQRVMHDEYYFRNLSLRLDVALILKTFRVVVQCTGV